MTTPTARIGGDRCTECGGPIRQKERGPPRETCSDRCRVREWRRKRAKSWHTVDAFAPAPVDPETHKARTIEALGRALAGAPPAAPEDRLVQILIDLRQIAWAVRRLERELHPRLAGPAGQLAEALEAATEIFPGGGN